MSRDPSGTLYPMGPGSRRARGLIPAFEVDPVAWFAWLERAVAAHGAEALRSIRPATFVDQHGHGWRIVMTEVGPEIRPGLENPFLTYSTLSIVTAILVTPDELRVELTTRECRRVHVEPIGAVRLVDVGVAMLTRTELPHDALNRIGRDTWAAGRRRWQLSQSALSTSAPALGVEIQPRAATPVRSR